MDINDLKNSWNAMNIPPAYKPAGEEEILSRVERGRISTLRDRLGNISRSLSQICLLGVLVMVPYFHECPSLAILAIAFFVFMGVTHFRNYRRVSRLNFSEMTVREAMETVGIIERNRLRLRAVGMALGIPLVLFMCFTFSEAFGKYYLYGCIAGGVAGLIIGLYINRKAVAIIREMRAQLNQGQDLE
ncbi:MAG: hypothetical protein HDS09_00730 [Bacteroides sp.]|nr:hypothetical protein [Bacteroides sp.]